MCACGVRSDVMSWRSCVRGGSGAGSVNCDVRGVRNETSDGVETAGALSESVYVCGNGNGTANEHGNWTNGDEDWNVNGTV